MENQPASRFRVRSEIIGIVEILNAVTLFATGYFVADKTFWAAFGIGALYAAGKNFVERCQPKNPYEKTDP